MTKSQINKIKNSLEERKVHTFFVTSYGKTATGWLTKILNSHPDIYCTHGPLLKEYNDIHNEDNTINSIRTQTREEIFLEAKKDIKIFRSLNLDEIILHMHDYRSNAKIYGNIHGFTAQELYPRLIAENFSFPYKHVNMVRHPFTRIESWVQWCFKESSENKQFYLRIKKYIEEHPAFLDMIDLVLSKYNVDFSNFRNRLFVYAILLISADITDVRIECKHIRYEQVVSDIEYFIWLFRYLTNNEVPFHNNLFKNFHNNERIGASFSASSFSISTVRKWEKWQIMLMRFSLETEPEMLKTYEKLNYEIEFIFDGSL